MAYCSRVGHAIEKHEELRRNNVMWVEWGPSCIRRLSASSRDHLLAPRARTCFALVGCTCLESCMALGLTEYASTVFGFASLERCTEEKHLRV